MAIKSRPVNIDEISKQIISELQVDGRKSYTDIGKSVGLSEAAVRQRIQRLTDQGVLQVVAVTDPLQLGFARQAMIGVRVSGNAITIAEQLGKIPQVTYVVLVAGDFDILLEVVCQNDDELMRIIHETIRGYEGVLSTESFVYLKLAKQQYNWGTR
ncbi:MAG: Lrp/AsnC family transcriptional regulator [Microbacteriaceae bacterium]|jgi:Lrp/AsnC family transcriptional regulator for asnA, asnC and gidA|nr:Lrp/AsnC family transcriptional regulator [Microbacteriaceae bacterium]